MDDSSQRSTVVVVGSAHMHLVVSCPRFPRPGEALLGDGFAAYPGGKGIHQAVACARLGGDVSLLAKCGRDAFRDQIAARLKAAGVHFEANLEDAEEPTGMAFITVDREGDHQAIVVPGSNMRFAPADLEARSGLFSRAAVALLQLEIPLDTVRRAAVLARTYGARVVLDPAPAQPLPDALLRHVDILTPSEIEIEHLTGRRIVDRGTIVEAAQSLVDRGVGCVVVTRGAEGCVRVDADGWRAFPAPVVRAVDPSGAGDTFNGALAYGLARGWRIDAAITLAVQAAAYSVTRPGVQAAMPTPEDLEDLAALG